MGAGTKQFLSILDSFIRTAEYILSILYFYLFGVGGLFSDWTDYQFSYFLLLGTETFLSILHLFLCMKKQISNTLYSFLGATDQIISNPQFFILVTEHSLIILGSFLF